MLITLRDVVLACPPPPCGRPPNVFGPLRSRRGLLLWFRRYVPQTMPSAGGQLSFTEEDCKSFSTFPLAPINIAAYTRNVTRRDRGENLLLSCEGSRHT